MKTHVLIRSGLVILLTATLAPALADPQDGSQRPRAAPFHHEVPKDPPAKVDPRENLLARSVAEDVVFGFFTSVQVNVDGNGMNILGDAANEPSIAVNPLDPGNIVIAWRQFDSVLSDFRQAGYAYSTDGGATWTFPGSLEPGVFRSDPVLDADSAGGIFYQSLTADATLTEFSVDVFRSMDGGATFPLKTPSFGGDKNWMTIDRSGLASDGHIYGIWQRFFSCCDPDVLTRSTDGGASFEVPVAVDLSPTFGTMAVGPGGELYMAGIDGTVTQDTGTWVVSRSDDASDPLAVPTSAGVVVDMGGFMAFGGAPNPGGLLGQADVAVDRSAGPTSGNVYLMGSVSTLADPLDVHLARSTDGGLTWTPPIRVNSDPVGVNWQWFAALDVAPDGRIDAIWLDTRADGGAPNTSQLFYAYSIDAGDTWTRGIPASPSFDSTVGWPNNQKLGDYMDLRSDATGADVAYAATHNGEQDVYYVRLFPDCNQNGVPDDTDLANNDTDCNGNGLPDECEFPEICDDGLDNDCDNDVDCADADCLDAVAEQCLDGLDNDCDGMIDCTDADCIDTAACPCDSDGVCETGEDCASCPEDCPSDAAACGDGVCQPFAGEDCLSCAADCNGNDSGPQADQFCCGGAGADGVPCSDPRCTEGAFACADAPPVTFCCGDLACEPGENPCLCPLDCGAFTPSETACADKVDNDCDGLVDCLDIADCSSDPPPPPPAGFPSLELRPNGGVPLLVWTPLPDALFYDVVEGDAASLRAGGGDFAAATTGCLVSREKGISALSPGAPPLEAITWFLVRAANCGGPGSYDGGAASQAAPRDAAIEASGNGCP